ncbi:hypothetical protein QZH41_017598 [Actinostola sp. cb2023]|nr:hypothetical protein QZH41_017598 [Actinostola sp. cb2023]
MEFPWTRIYFIRNEKDTCGRDILVPSRFPGHGCQDVAVGVADKNIIPDSSFTASSYYSASYAPKGARLNGASGWAPKDRNNANDYLQIDLGKVFVICALATQGYSQFQEWTTEYKISISFDDNFWNTYPSNTSPKKFDGNFDSNTTVKNLFYGGTIGQYIRIAPKSNYGSTSCMRTELYGVPQTTVNNMLYGGIIGQYIRITPKSNYGSTSCMRTELYGVPQTTVNNMLYGGIIGQYIRITPKSNYGSTSCMRTELYGVPQTTVVNNMLYGGTIGQYIRITPKSNNYGSTSCMRTELYGVPQTTVCTKMSVGLSYSIVVPDHRFTASSYYDHRYEPRYARLVTSSHAWGPKTRAGSDWLQIDLGSVVYLCAVATQGAGAFANDFAKTYKLRVSMDNINWEYYQQNNADKVFTGNTDKNNIVTNTLTTPTKAKFVRFYTITYGGHPSLRVEVHGIPTACRSPFGVEKGGTIQSNHTSSSSHLDSTHTASHGRLYGNTSWCSTTSSNTEYLQINLGKMMTLTGIATQGDRTMDKWVKNYTFNYSMDGNLWTTYRGGLDSAKVVIQGNTDKNSITVAWLSHPTTASHVRILPQTWNSSICMRIELYGCTSPSAPDITELSNQNLTASDNAHVDLTCKVQGQLIQFIGWYSDGIDVTSLSGGMTRGANFVKSVLRINYTTADDVVANYHWCCHQLVLSSVGVVTSLCVTVLFDNVEWTIFRCPKGSGSVTCKSHYICRAKYGKDDGYADGIKGAGIQVRLDYPSALLLTSVDNVLVKSVRLSWTQPVLKSSQASVQSYAIRYWNNQNTSTDSVASSATQYTINGLTVCTHYNVTIKAVSKLGDGPWSNKRTFRTDSDLPKVGPGDVKAEAKTSHSILVTWKVLSGVSCPPDGYKVIYSLSSGGGGKEVIVNGGQSTSHTLTNLNKWTVYYISVKVQYGKEHGPASAELVVRTLEDDSENKDEKKYNSEQNYDDDDYYYYYYYYYYRKTHFITRASFGRARPMKFAKISGFPRANDKPNEEWALGCQDVAVGVADKNIIPDSSFTASSYYDVTYVPKGARLNHASAWAPKDKDNDNDYLQIDLGKVFVICALATQGYVKNQEWTTEYKISTSIDNNTWVTYPSNTSSKLFPGNTDKHTIVKNILDIPVQAKIIRLIPTTYHSYKALRVEVYGLVVRGYLSCDNPKFEEQVMKQKFDGNFDSNTTVNNMLYGGTIGQYIRITPKSNYGSTSCMRTELYGVPQTTVCSKMSVGLSYSIVVPDHRFTASSYFDHRYEPRYARLVTSSHAWGPKTAAGGDWLQIDLGSVVYLCAVATQGAGSSLVNEFVKTYKLRVSMDNINWEYYQQNNTDKVFTGNTDRNSINVTNTLTTPTKAKFVRFYSITHHEWPSLRVEVYGIPTEYLQINLGKIVTLTGLATQGDRTMDKWVKTYTFKYSMDGNLWTTYRGGLDSAKVIQGNTNKNSITVTWLSHPTTARHVRVIPQTWNSSICMRIELYGCTSPSAPDITELSNQNLTASDNAHVDLTCKVQGQLIQFIGWYSDGIDVTSLSGGMTRGANFVKSVLRVNYTSADDVVANYQCPKGSGSVTCRNYYICRAKYGKDDGYADGIKGAGIQVRLDYPSALLLTSVDNILAKSVKVSWTQPVLKSSQASIQSYVIRYWNNHNTKTDIVASPATNHIISGLTVCTHYNVTIKAVSKLGDGPWSNTKNFRTDSDLPKVGPDDVKAEAKTSQSLLVTWKVPSGVSCPTDGYKVIYSLSSGGGGQEVIVNGGQTTSHTLTNLNKWTVYYISVKVRNEKGDGPASAELVVRTLEDAPSEPRNFKSSAIQPVGLAGPELKLTWDVPTSTNGIIRGYNVSYSKAGDSQMITLSSNTLTTSLPVCGGANYVINIWAFTLMKGQTAAMSVLTSIYGGLVVLTANKSL